MDVKSKFKKIFKYCPKCHNYLRRNIETYSVSYRGRKWTFTSCANCYKMFEDELYYTMLQEMVAELKEEVDEEELPFMTDLEKENVELKQELCDSNSEIDDSQSSKIDVTFIPETLTWCRQHYVPPVKEHIHCPEFGKSDGTNGSCWWCMEMTPYQWHMCKDESWVRGLMSPCARIKYKDRSEAVQFIEEYKQKHPMGNERKALLSEADE